MFCQLKPPYIPIESTGTTIPTKSCGALLLFYHLERGHCCTHHDNKKGESSENIRKKPVRAFNSSVANAGCLGVTVRSNLLEEFCLQLRSFDPVPA